MKLFNSYLLIVVLLSFVVTNAHAVDTKLEANIIAEAERVMPENEKEVISRPNGEPEGGWRGENKASFELRAKKDEKTASIAYISKHDNYSAKYEISTPVEKDTESAQPLTLDGLSSGSKFSISISKLTWSPKAVASSVIKEMRKLCKVDYEENNPGEKWDTNMLCAASAIKDDTRRKAYTNLKPMVKRKTQPSYLTITGTVAEKDYKYLNSTDLDFAKTEKESHEDYAGEIRYAKYLGDNMMLAIGHRHEKNFKGQTSNDLCLDMGGGNQMCKNIAIGAPKKVESEKYYIEYRQVVNGEYAISPLVWHDKDTGITGVQLPIYFAKKEKKGKFNGGIQVNWNDSHENGDSEVSAFVFIGSDLDFK